MSFSSQISQLESDLQEIRLLLEKSERKRVQDVLTQEQKKIEKEIALKQQQKEQLAIKEAGDSVPSSTSKSYTVKINNYGS